MKEKRRKVGSRRFVSFFSSPERDALCKRLGIDASLLAPPESTFPPPKRDSISRVSEAISSRIGIGQRTLERMWRPTPAPFFGSLFPLGGSGGPDPFPLLTDITVWAMIGYALAADEPEFVGPKRGRGRPPKGQATGIDAARANYIRRLHSELALDGYKHKLTDKALVEEALERGAKLFKGRDLGSLISSVARGNSAWRNSEKERQRWITQYFRSECERLRKRVDWLEDAKPDVERMRELNGMPPTNALLSDRGIEELRLRARLANPYRPLEAD